MDYSVFVVLFIFYVVSVVVNAGFLNARGQLTIEGPHFEYKSGSIRRREELGDCFLLSMFISIILFVGVFMVYLETGFGASGWSLKPERGDVNHGR